MSVAALERLLEKHRFLQELTKRQFTHARDIQINGEYKEVSFFVVQDEYKRSAARDLLNGRYGWRGYGSAHDLQSDIHHTTFAAEIDGQIVGTLTLGVDSECGLAIDRTFADVVDEARREPSARICELTKLAFEENVRSRPVLAGLFHMAYIYGTAHTDCTDLFIEVNPRHARFYEMMLGFRAVGSLSTNLSVGAPSRLMRIGVDVIRRSIREMTGAAPHAAAARSLYPHFFSPEEERRVRQLLHLARFPGDGAERFAEIAGDRLHALVEDGAIVAADARSMKERMRSAA